MTEGAKMCAVKDQRRVTREGNLTLKKVRYKETEPSRAKGKSLQGHTGERCEWKRNTKRERQREKDIGRVRGEKEGQTERWKVLWREGVFMSGCHRHSGTPLKRKKFDIEHKRRESCYLKDG